MITEQCSVALLNATGDLALQATQCALVTAILSFVSNYSKILFNVLS